MRKRIFLLLSSLFFLAMLQAQKVNLLGIPRALISPSDKVLEYGLNNEMGRYTDIAWQVFVDRVGVFACGEPESCGVNGTALEFKEAYYVTDEKDEWIKIVKAHTPLNRNLKTELIKDVGWVRKSQMLLWSTAMSVERTAIKQKAFVLNTTDMIRKIPNGATKEIAPIFMHPTKPVKAKDVKIYDFFFVYKKEGTGSNRRYLLGKTQNLINITAQEDMIGWINADRLTEWNTRLALEPNFDKAAFDERLNNSKYRVRAYDPETNDAQQLAAGREPRNQAYWDKDPVTITDPNRLTKDPEYKGRRYKGQVVRFPLLRNDPEVFVTGVVGDIVFSNSSDKIDDILYSQIVEAVKDYQTRLKKFKIIFFIEGTSEMLPYKNAIVEAIDAIDRNLGSRNIEKEIAVTFYRDKLDDKSKSFDHLKLTSDMGRVKNFISNTPFKDYGDQDDYTAMSYGILEGLKASTLDPDKASTNIFIFIGNNGDLQCDYDRRALCKSNTSEYCVARDAVAEKLSEFNPHLLFVKPQDKGNNASECYLDKMALYFMREVAKKSYQPFTNVNPMIQELNLSPPYLPNSERRTKESSFQIQDGVIYAKLLTGTENRDLTNQQISKEIEHSINDAYDLVYKLKEISKTVFYEGEMLNSTESFTPQIVTRILEIAEENDIDPTVLFSLLVNEKYKLFQRVSIPKRINGARHSTLSPVVFTAHSNLETYNKVVSDLLQARNLPKNQRKIRVREAFEEAYITLTGNEDIDMRDDVGRLHPLLDGICGELEGTGWLESSSAWWNCSFKEILNMNNEEITNFIDTVYKQSLNLKKIVSAKVNHPFAYTTSTYSDASAGTITSLDRLFYWIPLSDMFSDMGNQSIQCSCAD